MGPRASTPDLPAATDPDAGLPAQRRHADSGPEVQHDQGVVTMRLRHRDGDLVVAISGELDIWTAQTVRLGLRGSAPKRGARLVLDLSGVTTCDAAGLGVLVGELRRAAITGAAIRLAAPSSPVEQLLRATGMGKVLPVRSSVDAALSE